jgi:hypothetical protein
VYYVANRTIILVPQRIRELRHLLFNFGSTYFGFLGRCQNRFDTSMGAADLGTNTARKTILCEDCYPKADCLLQKHQWSFFAFDRCS